MWMWRGLRRTRSHLRELCLASRRSVNVFAGAGKVIRPVNVDDLFCGSVTPDVYSVCLSICTIHMCMCPLAIIFSAAGGTRRTQM